MNALRFRLLVLSVALSLTAACTTEDGRHRTMMAMVLASNGKPDAKALQVVASMSPGTPYMQLGGQSATYYPNGRAMQVVNNQESFKDATTMVDSVTFKLTTLAGLKRYFDSEDATTAAETVRQRDSLNAANTAAEIDANREISLRALELEAAEAAP